MTNLAIVNYITTSRNQGLSDTQIRLNLIGAGWSISEVDENLKSMNVSSANVSSTPNNSSGDHGFNSWITFQHILMFITLASCAIALAGIAHISIDDIVKGNLNSYSYLSYYNSYLLTGYVATIIVTFPIFAYLFVVLKKKTLENPEIRNIKARRIFIYIALIWTFVIIVTRVIRVVYDFIYGSKAITNSLAHLMVTLIISGAIFLYFSREVRKNSINS